MIFRTGAGSFRTSVGTATIWSPRASRGFLRRSMISMLIEAFQVFFADGLEVLEGPRRAGS